MGLNARIFSSFALMAVIVASIAWLGLLNNMSSAAALRKVITVDLPAEGQLGKMGRYQEAVRSDMHYLLNANLPAADRKKGHDNYKVNLAALRTATAEFNQKYKS